MDWVGEGVSDIVKYSGGFVPVPERSESRWQKNSAAWLDTLTVSYGMFPPLRLLSLSDSRIAPARNKLLRPTNEAASLLLKTITVRKMTLSFFLLPTLFHPHGRWTEVKAKLCSLRTSLLQCWSSVDALMKWHIIIFCFFNQKSCLRFGRENIPALPGASVAWRDEVRGLGERVKWNRD